MIYISIVVQSRKKFRWLIEIYRVTKTLRQKDLERCCWEEFVSLLLPNLGLIVPQPQQSITTYFFVISYATFPKLPLPQHLFACPLPSASNVSLPESCNLPDWSCGIRKKKSQSMLCLCKIIIAFR